MGGVFWNSQTCISAHSFVCVQHFLLCLNASIIHCIEQILIFVIWVSNQKKGNLFEKLPRRYQTNNNYWYYNKKEAQS